MTRVVHAAAAALTCLAVPGCLFTSLDAIPCERDDQCPSDGFCDVPAGVCVSTAQGDGAPDLNILRVKDGHGDVVIDPFVPPDEETTLAVVIENSGARPAENVALEFTALVCMNLVLDVADVPAVVEPGASVEVPFVVTPDGCSTPSIQDWFLFYSGRARRGTFNINIERAPPAIDD